MKVVPVYASTSFYEDEIVESGCEDVELTRGKAKTQYVVFMGDLNDNVAKKQAGDHAVGDYGIGTSNNRGELLVEFVELSNLRVMNTLFPEQKSSEWTCMCPNGETKN